MSKRKHHRLRARRVPLGALYRARMGGYRRGLRHGLKGGLLLGATWGALVGVLIMRIWPG